MPITSVNDRNSTALKIQLFFSALDQYSPGHCLQLIESEKEVMFTIIRDKSKIIYFKKSLDKNLHP